MTGSGGKVTSDAATLTVGTAPAVPTITRQPQSVTASVGDTVTMSVQASGDGLNYQWYYSTNGTSWSKTTVSGAKTDTITMQATTARNGNQYRCEVTGSGGKTTSDAAQLTVTQ